MMMQLGAETVFVGSGIFKSEDPAPRAKAIVEATTHYNDPKIIAEVSRDLGEPMVGIGVTTMDDADRIAGFQKIVEGQHLGLHRALDRDQVLEVAAPAPVVPRWGRWVAVDRPGRWPAPFPPP